MGKIDAFFITFDQKWSVYKPGDTVSGQVCVKLNDALACSSVCATFHGEARVLWIEHELHRLAYSSQQVFFNDDQILWPTSSSSDDQKSTESGSITAGHQENQPKVLHAGQHAWRFRFDLPADLPTSFADGCSPCKIEYWLKIRLGDSAGNVKALRKCKFCVVKPVDLNESAFVELAQPVDQTFLVQQNSKKTRLVPKNHAEPYQSKCLTLNLRLPATGFVPGEGVHLTIAVENKLKRSVKYCKAQIVQILSCFSDKPDCRVKDICKEISTVLEKRSTTSTGAVWRWESKNLQFPAVVPSFCLEGVADLRYVLRVACLFSKKQPPVMQFDVPLTVGTVPIDNRNVGQSFIVQQQSNYYQNCLYAYDNFATDFPLPTYEECIANKLLLEQQ